MQHGSQKQLESRRGPYEAQSDRGAIQAKQWVGCLLGLWHWQSGGAI